MKLPDFLIIGSARSGTTTLYRDLLTHPGIFFPDTKEPGNLTTDDVLTAEGLRAYSSLFAAAADSQLCGEATTRYTHRPDVQGVPKRARHVLGRDLKCLYIMRNPIDKIISTHHLYVAHGLAPADINIAVRELDSLLDHARYAMQVKPWMEEFGPSQVHLIKFETYVDNRRQGVTQLQEFLGVEPRPNLLGLNKAFNQSNNETMPAGPFAGISQNRLYRRLVRPLLSPDARTWLRRLVLPSMPARPLPPTQDTVAFILDRLANDLEQQPALFGVQGALWDFSEQKNRVSD